LSEAPFARAVHVLLVDRHDDTRHVLTLLLERAGLKVTAACSHEVAARAPDTTFDVILSAIRPHADQPAMLRAVREVSDAPAIAMIGFRDPAVEQELFHAGFDRSMLLPVTGNALFTMIADVVGERASRG
jgi:CheY-like chemotaxis protein